MTELLENSDNTNADTKVSESPSNEATISLSTVQALADALQKIESYTPTVWVDNESPDIDAAHLNKAEQAIMRVTTAMNSAVDVIKDLQSQVNTTNNNLSKAIISTDLFADYSSPTFVRWHYKTANTPYKAGLTYGQEGFALVFGSVSGWHTVISWLKGGRNMWAHYVSAGTDYGWSEYAQMSDLSDRAKKLSANFTPGNTVLDVSSWSVITLLSIVTYKEESTALYLLRKESSSKIYCIPVKSSTQVSVTYNGENKLILTNSATYGGTYTVLFLS